MHGQWVRGASGRVGVSVAQVEPSRNGFLLHCNSHKSMTIKIHFVCVDLLRLFDLYRALDGYKIDRLRGDCEARENGRQVRYSYS